MAEIGASSYRRFQNTDEALLDRILTTCSDALVRFCYSMVHNAAAAEDIAAESIAIFLTKYHTLGDDGHMRAYLYRIARYKCVDHLRFHSRFVSLEDIQEVIGSGDPSQRVLLKERNAAIYRCMQSLPRQYRQVLQLAYFDGFPVEDICRIIGKSAKQVYNLLARAKASLKAKLEQEGITHEDL